MTQNEIQTILTRIDSMLDEIDVMTASLPTDSEGRQDIQTSIYTLWKDIERAVDRANPYRTAA